MWRARLNHSEETTLKRGGRRARLAPLAYFVRVNAAIANDLFSPPATPPVHSFGVPPPGTTTWMMTRRPLGMHGKGGWQKCSSADESGTHVREWPLSELTPDVVRSRWGAGEYRVGWLAIDPETGAREGKGSGPAVILEPEAVATPVRPTAPAAPPPPPFGNPSAPMNDFERAIQVMTVLDQRANNTLTRSLEIASSLMTPLMQRQGGGLDVATLQLIMQSSAQQTQALIQQMQQQHEQSMTALRAELATLRRSGDDDDDDDDDDVPATVARAAAPLFRPGQPIGDGIKAAVANYIAQHPDEIVSLLRSAPAVIGKLSEVLQSTPTAPITPPALHGGVASAPPPPRPRAVPVESSEGLRELRTVAPPDDEIPPPLPSS